MPGQQTHFIIPMPTSARGCGSADCWWPLLCVAVLFPGEVRAVIRYPFLAVICEATNLHGQNMDTIFPGLLPPSVLFTVNKKPIKRQKKKTGAIVNACRYGGAIVRISRTDWFRASAGPCHLPFSWPEKRSETGNTRRHLAACFREQKDAIWIPDVLIYCLNMFLGVLLLVHV